MDVKAMERMYAGWKYTEGMDDGPDSSDMEEEGCGWPKKFRGITLLSQVLKLLQRVLDARSGEE